MQSNQQRGRGNRRRSNLDVQNRRSNNRPHNLNDNDANDYGGNANQGVRNRNRNFSHDDRVRQHANTTGSGFRNEAGNNFNGGRHRNIEMNRGNNDNRRRGINDNRHRGNNDNQHSGHNDNRRRGNRRLGFKRLEEMLEKDPDEIIVELLNTTTGFHELLMSEKTPDLIVLLLSIVTKTCTSKFISNKAKTLQVFSERTFLDELRKFIIGLPLQDSRDKDRNKYFWKDPNVFFLNLLSICEDYINTMQSTALEILPKIIRAVGYTLGNFEVEQNFIFADDVKDGFEALQIKLALAETEDVEKKSKAYNNEDHEEPPDNFRNISIYPLPAEITTNDRPFLRENIVEGKYKNVDHYLDVQFRLLREDFVAPLREGICNYMKGETKRSTNIKIYHRVFFMTNAITQEQMGFKVQFSSVKKNKVNFVNSKRFMYGSLILFTADNFRTIFFGKVVDRDIKLLNAGQVTIGFQEGIKPSFDIEYTMVESTVYFEPYFHVLTALQTLEPGHFPLQKYLIDVEACDETPSYFDKPQFKSKFSTKLYSFYDADVDLRAAYEAVLRNKSIVQPLAETYPLQPYLGLNNSQSIAFREALTNKFSIIQGPPGTGKTHLALKVAKTLLTNHDVWRSAPMLIVCYTNHALDQFLEGLLDTTKKIVRVGGN